MGAIESQLLGDALANFRKYKEMGERALAQVDDADLLRVLDPESNSIAAIVKHLGGNMRSRWTDFLTTDGEKPDRDRDAEFEPAPDTTREQVMQWWEDGWSHALRGLEALRPTDLDRTVTIRGEPHSVLQALQRQLTHAAYHVGQIVFVAKHFRSREWETLSIPRRR